MREKRMAMKAKRDLMAKGFFLNLAVGKDLAIGVDMTPIFRTSFEANFR